MKRYLLLIAILVLCVSCAGTRGAKTEGDNKAEPKSGRRTLGVENVMVDGKLSKSYDTIIIEDVSYKGASIQQVDKEKNPDFDQVVNKLGKSVSDSIASNLKNQKVFSKVVRGTKASGRAVRLETSFTKITTGNRALRFFVGFGAGSSTVGIKGSLLDAKTGKVLATFENNSHSPASMGDYHVVLPADGDTNARKIAAFIKKLY